MKILKEKAKIILLVVAAIAVILALILIFREPESAVAPTTGGIIYFYGEDCPHCKIVEKYIEDNNIGEKLSFQKKEVSEKNNYNDLIELSKGCGIEKKDMGWPMVYFEGRCYLGDADAISFFKEKSGI